ncbi:MAG: hypothetical protein H6557_34740 [Lewinellaceae bacterium]|nr:hypothetical protein [Phaeodactylibacter sp.]MCB9041802.1 hypothetical protein [Lewinellaceae bacterium]
MLSRYLQYLHADIRQAMRSREELEAAAPGPESWLAEARQLLIDDPKTTFGERCGLAPEAFPPAERLASTQLEHLAAALQALYRSWHLDLFLPECVPAEAAYPVLVNVLEKKLPIVTCGWVVVDFCEEGAACPFGKHCFCQGQDGESPCSKIDFEPGKDEWY